jgi:hypothetical protein
MAPFDPDAHRRELLAAFRIGPEDLAANRAGRLGPRQTVRLRRSVLTTLLLTAALLAGLVLILAFVATGPFTPLRWTVIGLAAAGLVAAGVHSSRGLVAAVRAGVVERIDGPVTVRMRGRSGWWLHVRDRSFRLPVRFWHVGPDLPYHVYVAPAAARIVAMEPWPADVTELPVTFTHTGDGERPYRAVHRGSELLIQVNDFPAEPLYSLYVDGVHDRDLEDWPSPWTRGPIPDALLALAAGTPRGDRLLAAVRPPEPPEPRRTWAARVSSIFRR